MPLTPENPTRDLVWQQRVKEGLERDASLQSHAKLFLQQIKLRVTPPQPVVAPVIAATAPTTHKFDKAELQAKARHFAEEFVRRCEEQKTLAAQAKAPPSVAVPAHPPPTVAEPAPLSQPRSIAEAAPAPRRARVLRNAAALARYASMPPFLGLCPTSVTPEGLHPGLL